MCSARFRSSVVECNCREGGSRVLSLAPQICYFASTWQRYELAQPFAFVSAQCARSASCEHTRPPLGPPRPWMWAPAGGHRWPLEHIQACTCTRMKRRGEPAHWSRTLSAAMLRGGRIVEDESSRLCLSISAPSSVGEHKDGAATCCEAVGVI